MKKDCRGDTERKQVNLQQNSTFYCSLVQDMQTVRQREREAAISALEGSAHWPEQLWEAVAVTQQLPGCKLSLFLLVRIHKLSQLTHSLNVKGRHTSKCRRPCISASLFAHKPFAKFSHFYILQNFGVLLSIFPPELFFQIMTHSPGLSDFMNSEAFNIFLYITVPSSLATVAFF